MIAAVSYYTCPKTTKVEKSEHVARLNVLDIMIRAAHIFMTRKKSMKNIPSFSIVMRMSQ